MADVAHAQIEKIIDEEIEAGKYPFPRELIHSLIKVESSWQPGIVNAKSGATGLMQVMPVVVDDYNKSHSPKILMSELKGTSPASIRKQIKIGLWILGAFWRGTYNYLQPRILTVPVDELVKIADLFYVAGPGATRKKLAQLSTPTYAAVVAKFPDWVALPHTEKVWKWTDGLSPVWNLTAIDDWVKRDSKPLIAGFDGHLGGFIVGAIVLVLGYFFLVGKKKVSDETTT